MASMIPVPYARQQPYRNPEYVRAMSDLMLQRGQAAQAAALLKGQNSQQLFQGLGGLAMSTFASMANSRDEQQKLRALQAERDRDYALKQREMEERAADRKADLDYRQRTEALALSDRNEAAAKEAYDNLMVGDLLTGPRKSELFGDTRAGRQLQRIPAQEALPAWQGEAVGDAMADAGPAQEARPELYRRRPSQQEAIAIDTAARQEAARQGLEWERLTDRERQAKRDKAEDDYRNAMLALSRQRANTAANNAGDNNRQVVETGGGQIMLVDRTGRTPAQPAMGPDGKPLTKYADTSGLGKYRNVFDAAISAVTPNRKGPLVERGNRLIAEGNEPEFKTLVTNAVLESTPAAIRERVTGRMETVAALQDAKALLIDMERQGVPTGWLTGSMEDLYRRFGSSSNAAKYPGMANRIGIALANYRRSMTGAAWTDSESKEYLQRFPNYSNNFDVNMAQVDSLLDAFNVSNRFFWSTKLGPDGAAMLGYGAPSTAAPGGAPTSPFNDPSKQPKPRP